jgi:adenosylhomocysteine nucleosidase
LVEELAVDPDLHKRAVESGAICSHCLFSADRVLVKASQKKDCSSRAQSVDMESFEIIKEANAWGARAVVVRAISDSANEDLPVNFNLTISANNRISIRRVILQLAKNPLVLPALMRFGRQSRNAAERLSIFLDRYILDIPKATVTLTPGSREAAAR